MSAHPQLGRRSMLAVLSVLSRGPSVRMPTLRASRHLLLAAALALSVSSAERADAAPFAYVSAGDLVVIDLATGQADSIDLAASGGGVVGSSDGSRVYVVHEGADFVSMIDTATNRVIGIVSGVGGGAHAGVKMAVSSDGSRLYVPNFDDGTVSAVDTDSERVDTFASGAGTIAVAVTPDGTRLYASNLTANNVAVINAATGERIVDIPLDGGPDRLAINSSGTRAYVPMAFATALAVIDTTTNTALPPVGIAGYPVWAEVSPDGSKVFVSRQGVPDSLVIVDAATNTVTSTLPGGGAGLAVTPDGKRVYAVTTSQLTTVDAIAEEVVDQRPILYALDVFIGGPLTTTSSSTVVSTTATSTTSTSTTSSTGPRTTATTTSLSPRPATTTTLQSPADPRPLRPSKPFRKPPLQYSAAALCRRACDCLCFFSANQFPPGSDKVRRKRARSVCRPQCLRAVDECRSEGGRLTCKIEMTLRLGLCRAGLWPDAYNYGCPIPPD